jgi:hypothetical protein
METDPSETSPEERAKAKLGLIHHAAIYAVVIGGLAILNLATSPHALWFAFPAVGWGIALVIHAISVFALPHRSHLYERLLERERRKSA